MDSLSGFLPVFGATVRDTLPIAVILFGFQFAVLRRPLPRPPAWRPARPLLRRSPSRGWR